MKSYSLHGIAGLVARSKPRGLGVTRSVYSAAEAGIDSDEPWVVVCEDHGSMVTCSSLAMARRSVGDTEWCGDCAVEDDEMEHNGKTKC